MKKKEIGQVIKKEIIRQGYSVKSFSKQSNLATHQLYSMFNGSFGYLLLERVCKELKMEIIIKRKDNE